MMFHGMGQLGDDNSAYAQKLATTGYNVNPVTPTVYDPKADLSQCEFCATSMFAAFRPACWNLNEAICSPITREYVKNAAPAAPPSQEFIDTHTPEEVIYDIQRRTQQAAVDAATQAAANQGSYLPPDAPSVNGVCVQGPQYNAILCFLNQNSGVIFGAGLLAAGIAFLMPSKGGKR